MARQVDDRHVLYLNTGGEPKRVSFKGKAKSILFDREYENGFTLGPFEPEFIEVHQRME